MPIEIWFRHWTFCREAHVSGSNLWLRWHYSCTPQTFMISLTFFEWVIFKVSSFHKSWVSLAVGCVPIAGVTDGQEQFQWPLCWAQYLSIRHFQKGSTFIGHYRLVALHDETLSLRWFVWLCSPLSLAYDFIIQPQTHLLHAFVHFL